MARALINDINVHYQTKGAGADVVLVHGLTANLAFWYINKLYPLLAADWRVTAYDLRGHGYSDTTPRGYTSRELAGDLLGLLDHLGIAQARIVTHSFGGSVGLHFALLYPERVAGLVLCDTGFAALRHLRNVHDWPGWQIWKDQLPDYGIDLEWFMQADAQGIREVLSKSADIPVQFGMRRGERRDTPQFRKLLGETSVATDFRDPAGLTEEALGSITPPVLAVYGEISPFRNVAGHLAGRLPNCRAEVLPGVGHFMLMDHVDLFVERTGPFLRDPAGYVRAAARTGDAAGGQADPASAGSITAER